MSAALPGDVRSLRVAIVHEWLVTYAGSERVLEQMLACFEQADVFCVVDFVAPKDRAFLQGRKPTTTFVQRLPFARKHYRHYLPLMPLAIEQLDVSEYDIVISSSHAVAKGVLTGPDQLHLCMCYSPIRYAWDLQHQYLRESGLDRSLLSWPARWLLHKIRLWDVRTANGVDEFIAISHFVKRRITKTYRRASHVIYPPVAVDTFELTARKESFYLTASRMVPYKRIDLIVRAFSQLPDKQLVVIGDGPEFKKIAALAGPNVTLLGYQGDSVLRDHMQRAKAFVFAAEEDFGIVPIEAQACGTPVIAYAKGGAVETVRAAPQAQPSGVFFQEQRCASLIDAIARFEEMAEQITAQNCRENALRFSTARFRQEFSGFVEAAWQRFSQSGEV